MSSLTHGWQGAFYDQVADAQHQWGVEVLDRLGVPDGSLILDAGCGSGRVTEELLTRLPAAEVVAVDVSASMIEAARARLARFDARVTFVGADLEVGLPRGLAVDGVISTGTLHWVRDHRRAFENLAGVLKPGAPLVAQAGGHGSLASVREILTSMGVGWEHLNTYATAPATAALLAECGYVDVWCWAQARPLTLPDRDSLRAYLDGAALGPYLSGLSAERRKEVLGEVVDRLPERTLDFVRLNILARRPGAARS